MIHFTLTGRYAGQTYCGTARNNQDRFMHPKFGSKEFEKNVVQSKEMCLACKEVYHGDEK